MSCVKIFVKNGRGIYILFSLFWLLGLSAANNQSNNHQIKRSLFDDYFW